MTTVILDTRTTAAKKILEFLKTQPFATVIEEKIPNEETKKSIEAARKGKVTSTKNVSDLMTKLRS